MSRYITPMWLLTASYLSLSTFDTALFRIAALAQNEAMPVAELASTMGKVSVLRNGERIASVKGMKLFASDQIVTGANSVAKILFADGSNFVVLQEGSVEVEAYWTEAHGTKTTINSMFNLVRGKARFFFKPREGGHEGVVKTANAVMGVRGTAFFVDTGNSRQTGNATEKKKTEVIVLSGIVAMHNPQKPEAEVLVKANEASVVEETTAPTPPAPAPKAEVAVLEKQVEVLPERIPDGEPAKTIELPPPTLPLEQRNTRGSDSVQIQRGTIIKQIITPQYMVVPTNAVVASKAGISCDKLSFDKFRVSAQNLGTDAPLMGSELVQCPGLQSESLFWLGFHHIARGETSRAQELPRLLRSKNIPLDVQTERTKLFQKAMEGSPTDLAKAVQAKNSPLSKDTEALLTVARAYTLLANHTEAAKYYEAAAAVPRLASNNDTRIEQGFAFLLKGDYDKAESAFIQLRDENLDTYQSKAVARGLELSEYKKNISDGAEKNNILLTVENHDDFAEWSKGGLGAYWTSNVANVVARMGDVKREVLKNSNPQLSDKTRFGEFLAGKSFQLSSGLKVDALAGVSQIDTQNDLEANISALYRFSFGLGLGGGFQREPLAFSRMVPLYAQNWQVNSFRANADFKRPADRQSLAEATLAVHSIGEFDTAVTAEILGRLPVHSGRTSADFLNLNATAAMRSHEYNMMEYESPKNEIQYGGGMEWGWKPFSWALVGANVNAGFVSRTLHTEEALETVSERNLYTPNKADARDAIKSESYVKIEPTLAYVQSPRLKFFLKGNLQSFQDTVKSEKSWTDNRFEMGLQWNYNAVSP
jgi:hypothetical protein